MVDVLKAFLQYNFNNWSNTLTHTHTLSPPLFAAANFCRLPHPLSPPAALSARSGIHLSSGFFFAHKTNYRQ